MCDQYLRRVSDVSHVGHSCRDITGVLAASGLHGGCLPASVYSTPARIPLLLPGHLVQGQEIGGLSAGETLGYRAGGAACSGGGTMLPG